MAILAASSQQNMLLERRLRKEQNRSIRKQSKKTVYGVAADKIVHGGLFFIGIISSRDRRKESSMERLVEVQEICKYYQMGEVRITAVDHVSFSAEKGEFVVIVGTSGAGKTTVLNLLGGMDTCDSGSILVDGTDVTKLRKRKLAAYRRYDIGFVFQFYNLVPNLTAVENVELATQISRNTMDAAEALDYVGLGDRLRHFPAQLSGGEQQRVSIARALAKRPKLLLCDEPTGALDYETGKAVLKLLQDTCRDTGMTVLLITHNQAITPMADRVITMKSGKIAAVQQNAEPMPVSEIAW
jgi:putative ABC transport system ATP-binding protein